MTRRERRQAEREGKAVKAEIKYTFTLAQIDKIRQEAVDEANKQLEEIAEQAKRDATEQAIRLLFALPALVLHDKFGFGRVRLDRFLRYVQTWVKACDEDPETLGEIYRAAEEETGYKLVLDGEVITLDDQGKIESVQAS